MTAFHPITPLKAVELVEAAGLPDGRRIIADYCAADLIKSYAQVTKTIEVDGQRTHVRGAAVPAGLWERMIDQDVVADVWAGGTVRIPGGELIGGAPAVNITAIGFRPSDVQRLIDHHRGALSKPGRSASPTTPKPPPDPEAGAPASPRRREKRAADLAVIRPGQLLLSIEDAGTALGIGRTKVNELMKARRLDRVEDVAGVRITVASVKALAGLRD